LHQKLQIFLDYSFFFILLSKWEKLKMQEKIQMENLKIRFAGLEDLQNIFNLYVSIFGPSPKNKAGREYQREKIYHHILSPYARVVIALIEEQLVGFAMFIIDEEAFANYIKKPSVLIRVFFRVLIGAYGYNLKEIFKFFKMFKRKANKKRISSEETQPSKVPSAYLTAYATHPDWRGRGIASNLLRWMISYLEEKGVEAIRTVIPQYNTFSLNFLNKLGFQEESCFSDPFGGTFIILQRMIGKKGELKNG
jgi:ribosomal protein S18 acetylase RimI-like enzyme